MPNTTIRTFVEADLDQLLELYRQLADGDSLRMPTGRGLSLDVVRTIVAEPFRHLMVAADGASVLGAAELILLQGLTHLARPWAVIENVIVAESVRGQGIGTQLLEHLIDLARASDCYKVQLHSGKQRIAAHGLYRKVGFVSVAEGFKLYFD